MPPPRLLLTLSAHVRTGLPTSVGGVPLIKLRLPVCRTKFRICASPVASRVMAIKERVSEGWAKLRDSKLVIMATLLLIILAFLLLAPLYAVK